VRRQMLGAAVRTGLLCLVGTEAARATGRRQRLRAALL